MDTEDKSMEKLIDITYEIFMLSPEEYKLLTTLMVDARNPKFAKLILKIQSLRGE